MDLSFHPLAEIFPLTQGAEFDELIEDIRTNGLREPIVLFEGQILDGRNRYRACQAAGLPVITKDYEGDNPTAYVLSLNVHRRHLNASQRALIVAEFATRKAGENQHTKEVYGKPYTSLTVHQAAALAGVNKDTIVDARRVLAQGTEEDVGAVREGRASVMEIAKEIREATPPEERNKRRAGTLSGRGDNPARIENLKMRGEIWGHVRDALTALTSLPNPEDVVRIARTHDRTGLVDARLENSLQWLTRFANAWRDRDEAAA